MGLLLTGPTALRAMRHLRCRRRSSTSNATPIMPRLEAPTEHAIAHARDVLGISDETLFIAVGRPSNRRRIVGVSCSACDRTLPARSVIALDDQLWISSPELIFLQMHAHLSGLECLALGFELCGHYSRMGTDAIEYDLPACATPGSLKRYLDRCPGARHREAALRTLRYVCARAASPRETQLALLLGLPQRYGGYGLERPVLNKPIDVSSLTQPLRSRDRRWADISWEGERIAVEYDSSQYHASSEKIARDAKRRTLLQAAGYHVVVVTNDQIKNIAEMDRIARAVSRLMGKRHRPRVQEYERKKRALHRALLDLTV